MELHRPRRNRGIILTSEGWQKLQNAKFEWEVQKNSGDKYTFEDLSERTRLTPVTLRKVLACKEAVDKRTIVHLFMAFDLELNKSDYSQPNTDFERLERTILPKRQDWGEAVDANVFYGRTEELVRLHQWLLNERCRLVALLGMGGIGKTSLAAKLATHIQDRFEYVVWRSLQDAPPVKALLAHLIQFLSNEQETEADLPENVGDRVSRLIDYLRESRCLLILDNAESILRSGCRAGQYRQAYEGYGELLKRVGEVTHQSCLVLTSREKPKDVASLEGKALLVRSLQLGGLKEEEGQKIFKVKGLFGSESECRKLVERYAGNALALKVVATTIQDLFHGNIAEFLKQETAVFGDIRELLNQQFERLSDLEKEIMYWLAINREPVALSEVCSDIVSPVPQPKLLDALESLGRRSLVEKSAALFTLQPVVMEYVTNLLIEQVCEEIATQQIVLFKYHALVKAQGKECIRDTQIRLILKPVIDGLLTVFRRKTSLENRLTQILAMLRETSPLEPGYTAGNVINLLSHLKTDLSGYDFSYLSVWQADLRNVNLHNANFAHTNLAKSVFAENFGGILSVAFSPDGNLLAMGDSNGEIRLYQVADCQQILTCKGHTNWVVSLAFSPDGRTFASSSTDHIMKLWDIGTGQCLQILQGHDDEVWSVAFSPDGDILASGSDDQTVRLWSVRTGECLRVLQEHTAWVISVAFSPDGQTLASGSDDQTVRLWDFHTGECLRIFQGHHDGVRSITFSPQGTMLVSGSDDQTVRLWDVSTGECLRIFQGHRAAIWSVAFSSKGDTLASGSHDQTVRLWDFSSGECLRIFQGHSNWVFSVAFSPRGDMLASGSRDQTARLWSVSNYQCLRTIQGYTNQVLSVTFSPDGRTLASGSHDQTVRLWDVITGKALRTLHGHTNWVYSVAFSPQGNTLASCSGDKTIKLWNVNTGQCLKTFQGHRAAVRTLAFSPDGQMMASGSEDQTIKLWNINTGQSLRTFQGHCTTIWSVAFSPQGTVLASGAWDQTVKLWDASTGECLRTLEGHTSWVYAVAFSLDGETLMSAGPDQTLRLWTVSTGECKRILQLHTSWLQSFALSPDNWTLASSSHEHTVKLWDLSTYKCFKTLQGHTGWIWSVTFCPDNQTLASSSDDETIRLWDVRTGSCLKTLKAEKLYERMNIMEVTGLTEATIATLKALGAVEYSQDIEAIRTKFSDMRKV